MHKKILYRDAQRKIEFDRQTHVNIINLRADSGEKKTLRGLASPFNQETVIGGWFREVILPGAYTKTLQENDQVSLWDHDSGKPLSRKSTGTLILRETSNGLEFEMTLGNQSWALDAYESIQRGDVQGVSIGFRVIKQTWTNGDEENRELDLREIVEVRLYEISIVTFPAYEGTRVDADTARSILEAAIERGDIQSKKRLSFTDTTGKMESVEAKPAERAAETETINPAGPGNSSTTDTTGQPETLDAETGNRSADEGNHCAAGTGDRLQILQTYQIQADVLSVEVSL